MHFQFYIMSSTYCMWGCAMSKIHPKHPSLPDAKCIALFYWCYSMFHQLCPQF